MKKAEITICLMAAVLVMATGQGFGWIYFNDGGTHNINYTTNDRVGVDYLAPGMQTTVNLLDGGFCGALDGYNNSRINMSGGSVYDDLTAHDSSQVTMSGGSVGGDLRAYDNSQATMSGGLVTDLIAYDSGQITMSGGSVDRYLFAENSSQVTMSGGSVLELVPCDSGQLTISGGSWVWLEAEGSSRITIDGSNFAIDGTPLGEITTILGTGGSFRRLTGTLANGDIINNQFRISDDAKLFLVPEPATLLLLGFGAVMMVMKLFK